MKAIILSAGQGKRLLPLTENAPKCSLPVQGRSILEWQFGEIAQCDVDEVVVVTGFRARKLEAIVAEARGVLVRTFYNPFFAHCDNLGTCWIAREEFSEPFVLINGDTLFEAAVLQRLLDAPLSSPISLVTDCKQSYDSDDMKVICEGEQLCRVGKQLESGLVNGESIGMMLFRDDGALLFRDKLQHLMRQDECTKLWYLSAIDQLAQLGHVGVCSIHGLSWCEIDDQFDLAHAETVVSRWKPAFGQGAAQALGANTV